MNPEPYDCGLTAADIRWRLAPLPSSVSSFITRPLTHDELWFVTQTEDSCARDPSGVALEVLALQVDVVVLRDLLSVSLARAADQAQTIRRQQQSIRRLLGVVEDLDRLESQA